MYVTPEQRIFITSQAEAMAERIGVGILDIEVRVTEVERGTPMAAFKPGTIFLNLWHPGTEAARFYDYSMLATQVRADGTEPWGEGE